MINTSQEFIAWLKEHELDLMERILTYAKEYGYIKYTSTLIEAWRISIVGLTDSLDLLMQQYPSPPSMGPDESFSDDPASQFGLLEAKRHRSRGVNFAMFISLFKYYEQTYHNLIEENQHLFNDRSYFDKYVKEFFNRVEIAYSIEWHGRSSEDQIHDLSEQNRTLANEKNLYLTIFDSLGVAIILLDKNGSLINYNPEASEILVGHRQRSGAFYYEKNKTVQTPEWLLALLVESKETFHYETTINSEDKVFDGIVMQMNDISGKFAGYVVTLNDMTTYTKMQEEVKHAQDLMIAQSRHAAMGEMISMIAHQWRQPLGVISMISNNMSADIVLDAVNEDEFIQSIEAVEEQVQYLSKTIDDFRNFFHSDKEVEVVQIIDVAKESISMMESMLRSHNIKIEINNNSTTQIELYSRELLQVFINILKNAKEAVVTDKIPNPLVRIDITEDDTSIKIAIFNTGNTISEDILRQLFDPYFSTKDEKNGTGLGLYITKTIVEKHLLGTIKVMNLDNGVCFYINLPK